MDADRPKAVVVIGAGASHDVWNEGTYISDGDLRPPLARQLFDATRAHVRPILERYPGAQVLAQRIAPVAAEGAIPLEQLLRSLASHKDERVRQHYKEVPPYLRDLLFECSLRYVEHPANYVQLVMRLLADHPHNVAFVVLNYDDLLERALSEFDPRFSFEDIGHYALETREAIVIKPHGSIDWFRPLPRKLGDWRAALDAFDPTTPPAAYNAIRVARFGSSCRGKSIEDRLVYPVVTAPLAGKSRTDIVCPKQHLDSFASFLAKCKKYLFLGTSGLDDDVLTFMADHMPEESVAHYVGVQDIHDVRSSIEGYIPQLKATSERAQCYPGTFRRYVTSSEMDDFLSLSV